MLIYNGQIIAGGGTIVLPMTRAEYEANKAILDSADVWVDLTDEPDQVATADQIAYSVDNVQKGMGYIGDIATKAIAKVEPTDTALYLHEVGTGFINKNGNYCITDVQIAVGGTITLGTNCHVVDGGISSNLALYYHDYSFGSETYTANGGSKTFSASLDQFVGYRPVGAVCISSTGNVNAYASFQADFSLGTMTLTNRNTTYSLTVGLTVRVFFVKTDSTIAL